MVALTYLRTIDIAISRGIQQYSPDEFFHGGNGVALSSSAVISLNDNYLINYRNSRYMEKYKRKKITNRKEDNDNFKYQVAFVTNKVSPSDNISNKVGGSRVWTSSYPKSSYTTSYWAPFLRLIEKSSTRKILRTISVEMKHLPISSSGEFSQIAKSWGVMGRVVGLGGVNLTIDRAAVGISEGWPLAYSLLGKFYYEYK